MKKLLLAFAAAVLLAFPVSASAAVTPYYTEFSACVSVDTAGVSGNGPISVNLYTPSGKLGDSFKTFARPQVYSVCISKAQYDAAGGFGWTAVAKQGGASLGSTVF